MRRMSYNVPLGRTSCGRRMSYNVPLGRTSCFPYEVSAFIYIYIYIELMWRQIIFAKFIEFDSCNFALKLDLCRKLNFFF